MKKMTEKEATLATDLLIIMKSNLIWEYEGFTTDGQGEIFLTQMKDYLDNMLLKAYETGYLRDEKTKDLIEAKHIKFLGNDIIEEIKQTAVNLVYVFAIRSLIND